MGSPVAQGQTLPMYDNFTGSRINSTKWIASESRNQHRLEQERGVRGGSLQLRLRAHQSREESTGIARTRTGLGLPEEKAAATDHFSARIRLDNVKFRGCASSTEQTLAGLRIAGYWLNDGTGTDSTGDVGTHWAALRVAVSDSSRPGTADVLARVFRCDSTDCAEGAFVFERPMGRVRLGSWQTIEIQHDRTSEAMIFKAGRRTRSWNYGVAGIVASDVPGIPFKVIRNMADIANCPQGVARPYVEVKSQVQWIRINE